MTLALRAVFITLGAVLLSAFSFMLLVFGLLLIATAIQLFRHHNEDPSRAYSTGSSTCRPAPP